MTTTTDTFQTTAAIREAAKSFMEGKPVVARRARNQGDITLSTLWRLISNHPGKPGVFAGYALDYGFAIKSKSGKLIYGVENPGEPDRNRRRVIRNVIPTSAQFGQAINEMYHEDVSRNHAHGVSVLPPEKWGVLNSANRFGGLLVEDMDGEGNPTGRGTRVTEPNHGLEGLASQAEAVAWRKLLGISEDAVSPLIRSQGFDTFIAKLRQSVSPDVELVFSEESVALGESDRRLIRNLGERRQPAALPERFQTVGGRAAAMRAATTSTSTTTSTTKTLVAAAPAPAPSTPMEAVASAAFLADLTTAVTTGKADVTTLTEYIALTQKIKALQEEAAAFLAKVKGE